MLAAPSAELAPSPKLRTMWAQLSTECAGVVLSYADTLRRIAHTPRSTPCPSTKDHSILILLIVAHHLVCRSTLALLRPRGTMLLLPPSVRFHPTLETLIGLDVVHSEASRAARHWAFVGLSKHFEDGGTRVRVWALGAL